MRSAGHRLGVLLSGALLGAVLVASDVAAQSAPAPPYSPCSLLPYRHGTVVSGPCAQLRPVVPVVETAVEAFGRLSRSVVSGRPAEGVAGMRVQGGVEPLWSRDYALALRPGNDVLSEMAVDPTGNVYVTGASYSEAADYDVVTLKYSPAGDTLWQRRFDGAAHSLDAPAGTALVPDGGVVVAGTSWAGASFDVLLARYDADGVLLWTQTYDGPAGGDDIAAAVDVNTDGTSFVAVQSWTGTAWDWRVLAFEPEGAPMWEAGSEAAGDILPLRLDAGSDNTIAVTGAVVDTETGRADWLTIRYGLDGQELWAATSEDPTGQTEGVPGDVAVGPDGAVYVTGVTYSPEHETPGRTTRKYSPEGDRLWEVFEPEAFLGTDLDVGPDGDLHITGTGFSPMGFGIATARYTPGGEPLWDRLYEANYWQPDLALPALAVGPEGDTYVVGLVIGTGIPPRKASVVLRYGATGDLVWEAEHADGTHVSVEARLEHVGVGTDGRVYAAGNAYGLTTPSDYVTVALESDGEDAWVQEYDGFAVPSMEAEAAAVGPDGAVYVAGIAAGETAYSGNASSTRLHATVVCFDAEGGLIWEALLVLPDESASFVPIGVVPDGEGGAYVAGTLDRIVDGTYDADFLTVRFDANGVQVWAAEFSLPEVGSIDYPVDMAARPGGGVVLAGSAGDSFGFGDSKITTVAYTAVGEEAWVHLFDGPVSGSVDLGAALAVDADGSAFVAGYSTTEDGVLPVALKYETDGTAVWDAWFSGAGAPWAGPGADIAADGAGGAALAASTFSDISDFDVVVMRLTDEGGTQWEATYGTETNAEWPSFVGLASDGSILVAASEQGGSGSVALRFTPEGDEAWAVPFPQHALRSAALDESGGMYLAHVVGDPRSGADPFGSVIKLDAAGDELWSTGVEGDSRYTALPAALAVGPGLEPDVIVAADAKPRHHGITTVGLIRIVKYEQATGTAMAEPGGSSVVLALEPPYPNPTTDAATVRYVLPKAGAARVTAYDVLGRRVATLAEGWHAAGEHGASWSVSKLTAGVYVVRLEVEGRSFARRVTVIREQGH